MVLFRGDIKSKSLQGRTSISIVLPADNIHFLRGEEEVVEKPYKTVYLLHGLFGSDDIYLANTNIQKFAEDNNIAVVIPSCGNSFYVDKVESHELYAQYVFFHYLIKKKILLLQVFQWVDMEHLN